MPATISPAFARRSADEDETRSSWLLVGISLGVLAIAVGGFIVIRRIASSSSAPAPMPAGVAFIVDYSDSMPFTPESKLDVDARLDPFYLQSVVDLVAKAIGYDRKLFVVVVSNNNSATWLYDIPPAGEDMVTNLKARQACRAALPGFKAFLEKNLRGPVSNKTDLVDALERVSAEDSQRSWRVVLASDGLQAARRRLGSVNLERDPVTASTVGSLVRLAGPASAVPGLAAASVQFVLPVRASNDRRFANDRGSTRMFWDAWFAKYAPSARIFNFETSPRPWEEAGGCR